MRRRNFRTLSNRGLYSPVGASYRDLYETLRSSRPEAVDVLLIGSHGEEVPELTGVVFEAVRTIVERWPQPPDPIPGRSWSELLQSRLPIAAVQARRKKRVPSNDGASLESTV